MNALSLTSVGIGLAERGVIPDALLRSAIRRLCYQRLEECRRCGDSIPPALLTEMQHGPIALVPELANTQHYEVPAEFFTTVLGRHRKYSCCYWDENCGSLDDAENAALRATCERAGLRDGMRILELGCGWGSLTLWMAEQFPSSRITAVSNSVPQRLSIEAELFRRGLSNVNVLTRDMNDFAIDKRFDRVVSVEMFEHMRNYRELLSRIANCLEPDGKLFVHIFCHREFAYTFETSGEDDWMGRNFFSGGIMPNWEIFSAFPHELRVEKQWAWNGMHYRRTAEAWLRNLDARRSEVTEIFRKTYGSQGHRWIHRWRMFFLAVAELFGFGDGEEWFVGHYLFGRGATPPTST